MSLPRRAASSDKDAIVALQQAAYAQNRAIIGVEPLPLLADYDEILRRCECWLAEAGDMAEGCLILEWRDDDLLIWSAATHPRARGRGVGKALLAFAERRAGEEGRSLIRLYTGEALTHNIAWYARHGFVVERIEQMADRRVVHMKKKLELPGG
jgi:ribosomal protein S18 acetylase RimI-like enzyme